jgi:hypothetical protein
VDEYDAKKGVELIFPGGIAIGTSSMDDVQKAYGDPSDTYESDTSTRWTYTQQTYASAQVSFDNETKKVSGMYMENIFMDEPAQGSSSASTGEVPDSVKNYKAPQDLGTDPKSFNVKYAGDLYTLPAPVRAFTDNGWTVIDKGVMIPARSYDVAYQISKNNQTLRAQIYNYSDTEQPAENCFVTKISCSTLGPNLTLELPGGITMDSSYQDIKKVFGEPDDTSDSSMFQFYEYGNSRERFSFSFSKETNKISNVEITHELKELGY